MKVSITQKGVQWFRTGHPWVYRSDVSGIPEGAAPGALVSVVTQKGQFLGQAFYSPKSQITLRMITRDRSSVNRDFWRHRIEASIRRRDGWTENGQSMRLVYGESDLLPSFIVDRYGDGERPVVVIQTLSAGSERLKEDLTDLLQELLNPSAIVERNDPPVRDLEGLLRQKGVIRGHLPDELWIRQGPLEILVDPLEGQKTGIFLDQADNHRAAMRYARGRVLDLFSYQGGFALPVSQRAEDVIAVDSSGPALEILKKNAARNGITNITCLEKNGFDALRDYQESNEAFDTVILDPPPFVRDRKNMTGALRGYKEINLRALKILKPGGFLITCSCSQNFTPTLFEQTLREAMRDARREVQVLERRGGSPDHPVLMSFPESNYLQCWIVRVI